MGKYQVQTFDGKSDDPKPVEMELFKSIEVRTPQGTAYAPLPEEEGQLIQIVFVEPPVKETQEQKDAREAAAKQAKEEEEAEKKASKK